MGLTSRYLNESYGHSTVMSDNSCSMKVRTHVVPLKSLFNRNQQFFKNTVGTVKCILISLLYDFMMHALSMTERLN